MLKPFKKFLFKNGVKAFCVAELLEKEIKKNQKVLEEKLNLIEKKKEILTTYSIDNEYFNVVLPTQIKELESNRAKITASNILRTLEMNRAREQGNMYNFDKNISQFVFNHLRNSLAHGYVKFPNRFDLSNASDTVITFEDYNPDDKKVLTFRGSIKLGDLLTIITSNEYVNNVLGMNRYKNSKNVLAKK